MLPTEQKSDLSRPKQVSVGHHPLRQQTQYLLLHTCVWGQSSAPQPREELVTYVLHLKAAISVKGYTEVAQSFPEVANIF